MDTLAELRLAMGRDPGLPEESSLWRVSAIARLLEDQERTRALAMQGPAWRAAREIEERSTALLRMGNQAESWIRDVGSIAGALQLARASAYAEEVTAASTRVSAMLDAMARQSQFVDLLPARFASQSMAPASTLPGALAALAIRHVTAPDFAAEFERQLAATEVLARQLDTAEGDAEFGPSLTWEQWREHVGWLFAILLFLLDQIASNAMEARLSNQIGRVHDLVVETDSGRRASEQYLEIIASAIDQLALHRPEVSGPQFVVNARLLRIRRVPTGDVVATVHRNQIVTVLGRHGKWRLVAFQDHLEGRRIEGWVRNKHLSALVEGEPVGDRAPSADID